MSGRRSALDRKRMGAARTVEGMPEIHAARRRRAQELIIESGADAALITAGPNVRYLTGLASSTAALLLPAEGDGALLATDSRYTGAARRDAADLDLAEDRFIEAKLATGAARPGGPAPGVRGARDDGRAPRRADGGGGRHRHATVRTQDRGAAPGQGRRGAGEA